MAVFKINKTDDYTVMSNTHLRDARLSLKAKGLLSMMFSFPPTWDYSVNGLVAIVKESKAAVESALKELKECGYLVIVKMMPNETKSGRIEYVYNIYEQPQKQDPENQPLEIQGIEKQEVEIQDLENPPQLNTDKLSTNRLSIDKSIIDYNTTPTADDENELKLIGGKLGKGVVMMTDKQFEHLCQILSKDELDTYMTKLADFIIGCTKRTGTPPTIKNHYKKILEWISEDRQL